MRILTLFASFLLVGTMAHAERVVFEKTTKKVWSDYSVRVTAFGHDRHNNGQLLVLLETRAMPPIMPPHNQPNQPARSYEDVFKVPGLKFDKTIGKRGAIVYTEGVSTKVCAVKKMIGQKETGQCLIDINDSFRDYTVRLVIK